MLDSVPSPQDLGLPEKFHSGWRPSQEEMILDTVNSNKRFVGINAGTGLGKSLYYMAVAKLAKERTIILTSTKGLQRQLIRDFESAGLVTVMGKSNYKCDMSDDWTCERGHHARCMSKGTPACPYSNAYFTMLTRDVGVTNYAYWIAANKYGNGLGQFDRIVLDEAHNAQHEIANAMQVKLSNNEIVKTLSLGFPTVWESTQEWKHWAQRIRPNVTAEEKYWQSKIEGTMHPKTSWMDNLHHMQNLGRRLATLSLIRPDDWVVQEVSEGYVLDPIRISQYAEKVLFCKIPKVTFVSATIRPKTLQMCGIKRSDFDFFEYPDPFPPENSPVYHIPTTKMDSKSDDTQIEFWLTRINQIIKPRRDRKGIIHTVSYDRRDKLVENSQYWRDMIYNNRGDVTDEIVAKFKSMPPPAILVSPSVTTGYDFPGEECEYQIIGKVPFPDSRTPVMQARQALDPEYGVYTAMQTLVQASGRSRRTPTDRSEVFIIDDHVRWLMSRYRHLAPAWFGNLYQSVEILPQPLSREGVVQ